MYHNKYRIIIPFLLPALLLYGVYLGLAFGLRTVDTNRGLRADDALI